MNAVGEAEGLQAINAYLEYLKNQGTSNHELSKCKHFLRYMLTSLKGKPKNGEAYRKAAEHTLSNFPSEPLFLDAVREFYYYWSGAKKPAETQRSIPTPKPNAAIPLPLAELLRNVEEDYWFKPELAKIERQWRQLKSIHDYAQQLRSKGCDDVSIEARIGAIKPLLYVLRDEEPSAEAYRSAVDGVLLMLPRTDRWAAFVSLAREFYYFWAQAPEAAQHLQLQIKTSDIREIYNP